MKLYQEAAWLRDTPVPGTSSTDERGPSDSGISNEEDLDVQSFRTEPDSHTHTSSYSSTLLAMYGGGLPLRQATELLNAARRLTAVRDGRSGDSQEQAPEEAEYGLQSEPNETSSETSRPDVEEGDWEDSESEEEIPFAKYDCVPISSGKVFASVPGMVVVLVTTEPALQPDNDDMMGANEQGAVEWARVTAGPVDGQLEATKEDPQETESSISEPVDVDVPLSLCQQSVQHDHCYLPNGSTAIFFGTSTPETTTTVIPGRSSVRDNQMGGVNGGTQIPGSASGNCDITDYREVGLASPETTPHGGLQGPAEGGTPERERGLPVDGAIRRLLREFEVCSPAVQQENPLDLALQPCPPKPSPGGEIVGSSTDFEPVSDAFSTLAKADTQLVQKSHQIETNNTRISLNAQESRPSTTSLGIASTSTSGIAKPKAGARMRLSRATGFTGPGSRSSDLALVGARMGVNGGAPLNVTDTRPSTTSLECASAHSSDYINRSTLPVVQYPTESDTNEVTQTCNLQESRSRITTSLFSDLPAAEADSDQPDEESENGADDSQNESEGSIGVLDPPPSSETTDFDLFELADVKIPELDPVVCISPPHSPRSNPGRRISALSTGAHASQYTPSEAAQSLGDRCGPCMSGAPVKDSRKRKMSARTDEGNIDLDDLQTKSRVDAKRRLCSKELIGKELQVENAEIEGCSLDEEEKLLKRSREQLAGTVELERQFDTVKDVLCTELDRQVDAIRAETDLVLLRFQAAQGSNRALDLFGEEYKCDICDKVFARTDHLKRHLSISHIGAQRHACSCGEAFSRPDHLRRHQQTTCAGNVCAQRHACSCGKTFTRPDSLRRHQQTTCAEKQLEAEEKAIARPMADKEGPANQAYEAQLKDAQRNKKKFLEPKQKMPK